MVSGLSGKFIRHSVEDSSQGKPRGIIAVRPSPFIVGHPDAWRVVKDTAIGLVMREASRQIGVELLFRCPFLGRKLSLAHQNIPFLSRKLNV